MMYDRMEPLTPMSAPTVVKRELSSMNPSATSANPEYAFRTVITTAIQMSVPSQHLRPRALTHVSATNRSRRCESLDEAQHGVCT